MPESPATLRLRSGLERRLAPRVPVREPGRGLRVVQLETSLLPHSDQRTTLTRVQPLVCPSRAEGFEAQVVSARTPKVSIHRNVTAYRMQAALKRQERQNGRISCAERVYVMQAIAAADCSVSHEPVLGSTPTLARRPSRPHDIGSLTIDTVRRVDPELSIDHLIDASGTQVGIEAGDFRTHIPANQKVGGDGITRRISGLEHGVQLAEGKHAVRAEGGCAIGFPRHRSVG